MKAILVVDIEETNLNECEISYVIQDKNGTVLDADTGVKLKPMPHKRVIEDFVQNDYLMGSKVEVEKMIRYVRARANNEIIDEILGEEE